MVKPAANFFVWADKNPADVRDDQPDPADDATNADRRSGNNCGAKDDKRPNPPGIDSKGPGVLFPHCQEIDAPADQI